MDVLAKTQLPEVFWKCLKSLSRWGCTQAGYVVDVAQDVWWDGGPTKYFVTPNLSWAVTILGDAQHTNS